jgi:hypothetical protein
MPAAALDASKPLRIVAEYPHPKPTKGNKYDFEYGGF